MQIKEAADKMLSTGCITQEEYDAVEESGLLEKDAAVGAFLKGLPNRAQAYLRLAGRKTKGSALGLGLGLTGIALFKESVIDPLMQASKIRKSLGALKEKVPALAEKDQNQVQEYFNVVKTFSPKSASNPLVAGALVNKMMEFGGVDHKLVQDISAIEQGLQRPSVSQTVAEGAAKAVTGA